MNNSIKSSNDDQYKMQNVVYSDGQMVPDMASYIMPQELIEQQLQPQLMQEQQEQVMPAVDTTLAAMMAVQTSSAAQPITLMPSQQPPDPAEDFAIARTPSMLCDLPSTDPQTIELDTDKLEPVKDSECFRWRDHKKPNLDLANLSYNMMSTMRTKSQIKDMPSMTLCSIHVEQSQLKPLENSEVFKYVRRKTPVADQQKPRSRTPQQPPQQPPQLPPQPPPPKTGSQLKLPIQSPISSPMTSPSPTASTQPPPKPSTQPPPPPQYPPATLSPAPLSPPPPLSYPPVAPSTPPPPSLPQLSTFPMGKLQIQQQQQQQKSPLIFNKVNKPGGGTPQLAPLASPPPPPPQPINHNKGAAGAILARQKAADNRLKKIQSKPPVNFFQNKVSGLRSPGRNNNNNNVVVVDINNNNVNIPNRMINSHINTQKNLLLNQANNNNNRNNNAKQQQDNKDNKAKPSQLKTQPTRPITKANQQPQIQPIPLQPSQQTTPALQPQPPSPQTLAQPKSLVDQKDKKTQNQKRQRSLLRDIQRWSSKLFGRPPRSD